ncbi:hypothetical protein OG21DRAFT_1522062 [Imleria badia]|nr:hypothetical protein OG21DRAFT_1522062 [Imleria badia]
MDDLPPGSTVDNVWQRLFISALAHFSGGYDNPWAIPSDEFTLILQQIWNVVYERKIEHNMVANGGPVYHLAKQAAVAVITTFFANYADFADPAAWSGLWRGLFILQTFAHHFNFIQGKMRVATLDNELPGPRTALALACAAVSRMLTLIANNDITFESVPGNYGNVWTARYLESIKSLTDENFSLVIEETQKFVKTPFLAPDSVASGDEDSEFEHHFVFR